MNPSRRHCLALCTALLALLLTSGCETDRRHSQRRVHRLEAALGGTWVTESGGFRYVHFSPSSSDISRGWLQTESGNRSYRVASTRAAVNEAHLTLTDSTSEGRNTSHWKVEVSTNGSYLRVTRAGWSQSVLYHRTTSRNYYYDRTDARPVSSARHHAWVAER